MLVELCKAKPTRHLQKVGLPLSSFRDTLSLNRADFTDIADWKSVRCGFGERLLARAVVVMYALASLPGAHRPPARRGCPPEEVRLRQPRVAKIMSSDFVHWQVSDSEGQETPARAASAPRPEKKVGAAKREPNSTQASLRMHVPTQRPTRATRS